MNRSPWDLWLDDSLSELHSQSLFRSLRPGVPGTSAVETRLAVRPATEALPTLQARADLRTVKLFSLNDYLGLSTHPRVRAAAAAAANACGNGPRSSPLVGGYTVHHRELETALAQLKGTEETLLFPTGFAANVAVVSTLASAGTVDVFSDELNHASIVDGARLGRRNGAGLHIYRHNDLKHLDQLLSTPTLSSSSGNGRLRVVVTDSLFSMDGDFADLAGLAGLKRKHGFLLAVDEAHSTLVCGPTGAGAAEAAGVTDHVDLHIGTLSKAFGSLGGFVACSSQWKDLFVNKGRTQVFSTSLPVPIVAAAHEALRTAGEEPWRRQHVWRLVDRLGRGLGLDATSPIIPVVLGDEGRTMKAGAELLELGFHVPGIRPPTVPPGTSRLRISVSAAHTTEDVDALIVAIQSMGMTNFNMQKAQDRDPTRMSRL